MSDLSQKLQKRSVTIAGHRSSLSLEGAFWTALKAEARAQGMPVKALIEAIDRQRSGNLSSAVRVYLLGCAANRQGNA